MPMMGMGLFSGAMNLAMGSLLGHIIYGGVVLNRAAKFLAALDTSSGVIDPRSTTGRTSDGIWGRPPILLTPRRTTPRAVLA